MITSAQIRKVFLDYFLDRSHAVVPSSSLVPGNDPTLLFTNAGMVQFKDIFTGAETRSYTRATSAQKCMRVSGKHNDLENVGPSPRHHTFFEMLGNFSFGDYFKREAITYAWEFLTGVMKLDAPRLYPTIYQDDDEAFALWQEIAGVPGSRITRLGKKDNFWAMGDTGPNGPCSEIIYDRGPQHCTCGRPDCNLAVDCERWWELWNLVFMQFETLSDGTTRPLPKPSIDTGMGMERLTAVMQGKDDNYQTDLFWPIILHTQQLLGHSDQQRTEGLISYRVIADHARAIAFLIADGVLPGNEGRNYVLRLILRRAARHGRMLGFEQPFMAEVLKVVIETMGTHYTDLEERRSFILEAATQEEERFLQTLDTGLTLLDQIVTDLRKKGQLVISGDHAFRLYDTYGFPLDLTKDVAKEQGLTVDVEGFRQAMEAQRERARSAQQFVVEQDEELFRELGLAPTGHDPNWREMTSSGSSVEAVVVNGQVRPQASSGDEVRIVLNLSPFYPEAGGQVGDTGIIEGPKGRVEIRDAVQPVPGITVHIGEVTKGTISAGDLVTAAVDSDRRLDISRNHTATHLLHHALRDVLGDHARQAGSLVAPDRLRFDFTHLQPVTEEQLQEIERQVNEAVRKNLSVIPDEESYEEARQSGAVALFGEKYGDRVRVVSVGEGLSRELCGGAHLTHTGEIGFFKIVSESSIGSGLRRIEAVTGRGAERYVRERLRLLHEAAAILEAPPTDLVARAEELTERLRSQEKEIEGLRRQAARQTVEQLLDAAIQVDGATVLSAEVSVDSVDLMREMTDELRQRLGSAVVVLGAVIDGKPMLIAAVTPDLVDKGLHAGNLVGELASKLGGGGGGRPNMAQAGGRDAAALPGALASTADAVRAALGRG